MKIKEIMTKNPIIVSPSTTQKEIQRIFNNKRIWSIFIGNSDQFLGIITRKYFFDQYSEQNMGTSIERIMSKRIITLDENLDVTEAIQVIKNERINGIGVTRNGKPCGIITRYDIKKYYHPGIFDNRDFSRDKRKKMITCDYCNHKIDGMPYHCKRCGGSYCSDHRLPESHECSGVRGRSVKKPSFEDLKKDLTSGNKDKRRAAAIQLEKIAWVPETESQKGYYLFAHQRWNDLIKLGNPALEPLLFGLMDPDITIQESSANSLGALGNPVAIDPLIQKLYVPHTSVRIAVALALNNLGWMPKNDNEKICLLIAQQNWDGLANFGKKSIEPLSAIYDSGNEDIKLHVISILRKIPDDKIIGILTKAVQDKSKKIRLSALEILTDIKSLQAVNAFLIALNDSDSACRRFAVSGLIQQDTNAVVPLIELLNKDVNDQTKKEIIDILGEIQDSRAKEPLHDLSRNSNSKMIKEAVQMAIKKIDSHNEALKQKSNLYCLNCFSHFTKNKLSIRSLFTSSEIPMCRNCKNNKNYIEGVQKVVLLLGKMDETYHFEDGVLSINWFTIKKPIDVNEILILEAANEDISEFVMKFMNDEDRERKKLLKLLPVYIVKEHGISQAKINLLKNTFGNIHLVEKDNIKRRGE